MIFTEEQNEKFKETFKKSIIENGLEEYFSQEVSQETLDFYKSLEDGLH